MKKIFINPSLLVSFSALFVSSLAFAEEAVAHGGGTNLGPLAAAIAIGLSTMGAASGQGRAAGKALEGLARNPDSSKVVFVPLLLTFAFIEFLALLGFVIAFFVKG